MVAWAQAGEVLITPMIAWFEFRCGPVIPSSTAVVAGAQLATNNRKRFSVFAPHGLRRV